MVLKGIRNRLGFIQRIVVYGEGKVGQLLPGASGTRVTGPIGIEGAAPREATSEVDIDIEGVCRKSTGCHQEQHQPRQRQSAEKRARVSVHMVPLSANRSL